MQLLLVFRDQETQELEDLPFFSHAKLLTAEAAPPRFSARVQQIFALKMEKPQMEYLHLLFYRLFESFPVWVRAGTCLMCAVMQ